MRSGVFVVAIGSLVGLGACLTSGSGDGGIVSPTYLDSAPSPWEGYEGPPAIFPTPPSFSFGPFCAVDASDFDGCIPVPARDRVGDAGIDDSADAATGTDAGDAGLE